MMRKNFLLVLMYLTVIWSAGIFVFGKAGIFDNIYQEKEIVRLTELVLKSRSEIEMMTREYGQFLEMKTPTQAFLVEQGRKTKDIIVFSDKKPLEQNSQPITLAGERTFFLYLGIGVIFILTIGIICIMYVINKKSKSHEEIPLDDSDL